MNGEEKKRVEVKKKKIVGKIYARMLRKDNRQINLKIYCSCLITFGELDKNLSTLYVYFIFFIYFSSSRSHPTLNDPI